MTAQITPHDYEVTYLSDASLGEEERQQMNNDIDRLIEELAGMVSYSSPDTHRRLWYPLKKNATATLLRTLQIQLDPAQINQLSQHLKKAAGVMRFSILRTSRREEMPLEIIDKYTQKKSPRRGAGKPKAPAKAVTMAEVEKGIEEALTEEVK